MKGGFFFLCNWRMRTGGPSTRPLYKFVVFHWAASEGSLQPAGKSSGMGFILQRAAGPHGSGETIPVWSRLPVSD
jgi:hypothetical protein